MESSLQNKKVLVTGATGLIGSNLVSRLLKEYAIVIVLGRNEEKIKNVFKAELGNPRFSYLIGNISEKIPNDVGVVDYIFHMASPISRTEIILKPVDTIEVNLGGTKNCLEYLRKQDEVTQIKGRMIVFSSATVYGNISKHEAIVSETDTNNADILDSLNAPYSESKRMVEILARAYYIQYKVESVIARIGYVYGFSKNKPDTAFYEFIKKVLTGEDIVLNNSGMGRRDNIYVSDVVNGLILLAISGLSGESYNISSNGEMNNFKAIDEIAEILAVSAKRLNCEVKVLIKKNERNRNPGMILDNSKIKKLGWAVNISIEDGIYETVKKYMEEGV